MEERDNALTQIGTVAADRIGVRWRRAEVNDAAGGDWLAEFIGGAYLDGVAATDGGFPQGLLARRRGWWLGLDKLTTFGLVVGDHGVSNHNL